MSLILKGIDLPKEGEHIVILIQNNGKCTYWKQDTEYGICVPKQTVEAVQIPTPHGRMIDADALFEAMGLDTVKEVMLRNWKFTTAWGVPIIEAEE